jgi:hypothetical protein
MCDMATIVTTRDFVRRFSSYKKTVANGNELVVKDRTGRRFVFRSEGPGPSLGNQLHDLCGSLHTGVPVKDLSGFGRNRA